MIELSGAGSFHDLIERPELVDDLSRSSLPAVIIYLAAIAAKSAALQSRIAARLVREAGTDSSEETDRMATVGEAADALRYRTQYVYQLIREGRLRAKREGRKIRIRWSDLKAYMQDCAKQMNPGANLRNRNLTEGSRDYVSDTLDKFANRTLGPRRYCREHVATLESQQPMDPEQPISRG